MEQREHHHISHQRYYAGFRADAAAYRAAVRRNGGHLPTCKRK